MRSRLNWDKVNKCWFWLGLMVVLGSLVPYLLLGKDAVFTYNDQLDGELIAYLLQAKHLFQGSMLPEFMGGVSKTALVPPAPLGVLFFLGGDGYVGLMILTVTGKLVGYLGMFLLCREAVKESWIAAVTGVLYALIPFLPVYGLSQFGIPLLFWCVLQMRKKRYVVWTFCYVALYTLCSSLVLVGFGLLGMGLVLLAVEFWKKHDCPFIPVAWLFMLLLYVLVNWRLIWQLMGGGAESHKAEYVLHAVRFSDTFVRNLTQGGQHSQDYHIWLLALSVIIAAVWLIRAKQEKITLKGTYTERLLHISTFCLCWNVIFALASALWESSFGVGVRSGFSAFGAFQLNRLLWISPCLWYLLSACSLGLVWHWVRERSRRFIGTCLFILSASAVGVTGVLLLLSGDVKTNVQKLRHPDYPMIGFRDYYAIGVMDQVEEFLYDQTGQTPEAYRVVSLGIDPAAALYQGFYCLDGYSNNYPLEYKHAFRQILLPELEKSDYLKEYFDGWGNRCYLFSSEVPGYYTIEKNGFWFQNYELNADALRDLGGDFLLSAAYIANAQEQGLTLLREEPFETETSYYRIFVYRIDAGSGQSF